MNSISKCHSLSRSLSGSFSSIEEVEGKDLFLFLRKIERARTDAARFKEVIEFAKRCMTAVENNLPVGTVRGEQVIIRARTRNPEAAHEANIYLAKVTSTAMLGFLQHILHPELSLVEAAEIYHGEFRYKGRPVGRRRLIGTTLLVKGLEFDHAIVLDAASLPKKELYVALTRGARSLTIISTDNPGA